MINNESFGFEFDDKTRDKIIGIWSFAKHIPLLKFQIANENMRIGWARGFITDIPLNIFMHLSGTEIVEIIDREKEKNRGWK
jgi:hypothetical protein